MKNRHIALWIGILLMISTIMYPIKALASTQNGNQEAIEETITDESSAATVETEIDCANLVKDPLCGFVFMEPQNKRKCGNCKYYQYASHSYLYSGGYLRCEGCGHEKVYASEPKNRADDNHRLCCVLGCIYLSGRAMGASSSRGSSPDSFMVQVGSRNMASRSSATGSAGSSATG